MSISRVFAATAIAATFSLTGAQAQSLQQGLVPAEFPPASYNGRQYVDSDGCVFIRAGVDGNVTWVPRVSRSRKAICGFKPTFTKPAVTTASVAAPKPKAARTTPRKSVTIVRQKQTPPVAGQPACRGGNAVSQQYVGRVGQNVRCGPQQGAVFARRDSDRGTGPTSGSYARAQPKRVVPRHVYESQVASIPGIKVPAGYKPAWDDDRLNPRRAHQTLSGQAQMNRIWTETLPRKLIRRDK